MHGTVCIGDAVNWDAPLNRGLASWWLALPDHQRGNVFRDLCLRNHGDLASGAGWAGSALLLDGTNDRVRIPTSTSLKPPFPLTLSASVLLKATGVVQVFFNNDNGVTSGTYAGASISISAANVIVAAIGNNGGGGGGNRKQFIGTTALTTGVWYDIAAVFTSHLDIKIYIDGKLEGTTTSGTTTTLAYSANAGAIGCAYVDVTPAGFLNGCVRSVAIHNRGLTEDEVRALHVARHFDYPEELNWTPRHRGYEINAGGAVTAFPWHYYQQMMAG